MEYEVNGQIYEFPDSMSQAEVLGVLRSKGIIKEAPKPQSKAQTLQSLLSSDYSEQYRAKKAAEKQAFDATRPERAQELMAQGARQGGPMLAGAFTGGLGLLPTMLAAGAGGAAGEGVAEKIEGKELDPASMALAGTKDAALTGLIGGILKVPGAIASARRTAQDPFAQELGRAAVEELPYAGKVLKRARIATARAEKARMEANLKKAEEAKKSITPELNRLLQQSKAIDENPTRGIKTKFTPGKEEFGSASPTRQRVPAAQASESFVPVVKPTQSQAWKALSEQLAGKPSNVKKVKANLFEEEFGAAKKPRTRTPAAGKDEALTPKKLEDILYGRRR